MTTPALGFGVAAKIAARLPQRWRGLFDTHRVSVHLDVLVCQRAPVYEKWGYAGRSIEQFPPYHFFKLCLTNRNAGTEAFKDWYRQRFFVEREWAVPSSEGGLQGSSLHRLIIELHRKTGRLLGPDDHSFNKHLVERAIELRVSHYVSVLSSLRQYGYLYRRGLITCVRSRHGDLEIREGHHRAAAACVLGLKELIVSLAPHPDIATPPDRRLCASPDPDTFAIPARDWNDAELKEWIARQDWYQSIPIRNGIMTPGLVDSPRRLRDLKLPSLAGKSVLDVGCNAGMYAFECERLGASRVVGVDIEEYSLRQAAVLKELLGSRVEFRTMPLDQIAALGTFDYVLCIAVLHEVPDPVAGLRILKTIAREVIYLEMALWKPLFGATRSGARRAHNRRGWTLLPTPGLVQAVLADSFAATYLGRSARYDLFRFAKTAPEPPSRQKNELA